MNTSLKRTGAAVLAAVGIAAGGLAATAPASAAPPKQPPGQGGPQQPGPGGPGQDRPQPRPTGPGDLALTGGLNCYWKSWGPTWDNLPGWRMHRWMEVRNVGSATMTNVRVFEINGPETWVSIPRQPRGVLRPGQSFRAVDTTWRGCWPSSVSGYTIASQTENLANNWGFWANIDQRDGNRLPVPRAPQPR